MPNQLGSHDGLATDSAGASLADLARNAADGLGLAAAPIFAVVAMLVWVGGGSSDNLCGALRTGSPPGGMVTMYVLMSIVHAAPWLRLMSKRACRERDRT